METTSLDSMRRAWCAMPAPMLLLVIAMLFSVQDLHASGPGHGPDAQDHVEMMSPAHDSGELPGNDVADDCSVSSCSLCLAVIPREHSAAAGATGIRGNVVQRAAPATPFERLYRPPILSA